MTLILFYLLIGAASYFVIAPASDIEFKGEAWWAVVIAAAIWAVIWFPALLFKIGDRDKDEAD